MNYCTNCGAQLENDTKFCPNCGAPVNADLSATNQSTPKGTAGVAQDNSSPQPKQNKKRSRKPLIIILILVAFVIIAFLVLAAIGGGSAADQKIVYEGIEFQVPNKWKLDEDSSSDAGLYFYTNGKTSGEMLYMVAVPDVTYLLDLFGADYVMDWMTEYIHEQTGGETVDAQKIQTAGYDTYVYDVTGASNDVNGDSVQGGYRIACILNSDKSEMILVYAYGLSAGENDQKILSDIDYILENATATSEANSY